MGPMSGLPKNQRGSTAELVPTIMKDRSTQTALNFARTIILSEIGSVSKNSRVPDFLSSEKILIVIKGTMSKRRKIIL